MDPYRKPDWWLAHERGERAGQYGAPDVSELHSVFRDDYIAGYFEGFIRRKAWNLNTKVYDLNGLTIQGRYPNSPPYAAIG